MERVEISASNARGTKCATKEAVKRRPNALLRTAMAAAKMATAKTARQSTPVELEAALAQSVTGRTRNAKTDPVRSLALKPVTAAAQMTAPVRRCKIARSAEPVEKPAPPVETTRPAKKANASIKPAVRPVMGAAKTASAKRETPIDFVEPEVKAV